MAEQGDTGINGRRKKHRRVVARSASDYDRTADRPGQDAGRGGELVDGSDGHFTKEYWLEQFPPHYSVQSSSHS